MNLDRYNIIKDWQKSILARKSFLISAKTTYYLLLKSGNIQANYYMYQGFWATLAPKLVSVSHDKVYVAGEINIKDHTQHNKHVHSLLVFSGSIRASEFKESNVQMADCAVNVDLFDFQELFV